MWRRTAALFMSLHLCTSVASAEPSILVTDGFARPSIPGTGMGVAYLSLSNRGPDDRLLKIRSPLATMVEIQVPVTGADGNVRPQKVTGGLPIASGGTLDLDREGGRIMLYGLSEPLVSDAEVPMTLQFEKAGEIEILVRVDAVRGAGES